MACTKTGYTLDELRTRYVWQLHPPEEEQAARVLFDQVRDAGHGGSSRGLATKSIHRIL